MLGTTKAKKVEVLSHWYTLVDRFNISCQEFYDGVERELTHRKVPNLTISRVTFSEGGILSANREYLRMKRERLVFDICAAPFGTSYFFSMRFAELPPGSPWWQMIPILGSLALMGRIWFFSRHYAVQVPIAETMVVMFFLFVILWFIGNLGRETYYRQDTRLMYLEVVNAVIKQKIAESTSAQGINLLNIHQHSPLMDNVYRTTQVDIQPTEAPSMGAPASVAS